MTGSASLQGGNIVVPWTGEGTLQSAPTATGAWGNVTPQPTGNSYTVPADHAQQDFRVTQLSRTDASGSDAGRRSAPHSGGQAV
ncbi:MAG TPA: hypothetical protein PKM43_09135 [Verrucomicrobiota bacterium]|nr:hypothetical protein [Verrucomicrobiota bacterium]HRZ37117.1 hypothetical protein [Candidatus Paceibacterota bacterium]HRZ54478.1 hypothetical protein [Candidatus Paceibacterota bacterium]